MTTAWPFDEATKREIRKQMRDSSRLDDLIFQAGCQLYDKKDLERLVFLVLKDCFDILEEGNKTQMTSRGALQEIRLHFGMKE